MHIAGGVLQVYEGFEVGLTKLDYLDILSYNTIFVNSLHGTFFDILKTLIYGPSFEQTAQ